MLYCVIDVFVMIIYIYINVVYRYLCDDCGNFKRAAEHKKGESNDSIIVADDEFLCKISKQEGGIVWTMMEHDAKRQRYLSPESPLLK